MSVQVKVPPRYVRLVNRKAVERNRSFKENIAWNNNERSWGVDPEHRNLVGLMGEMAFAIYADLSIDSSIVEWSDGGYDFDVYLSGERQRVDVKTAQKKPGSLFVKEYRVYADAYVQCHWKAEGNTLSEQTVTIYGSATKEQVLSGVRSKAPKGSHYNYTIPVEQLKPLPDPGLIEPA